ncbi:conserved Plasmodium protein, unknown function [Plasmodium vinckei lentum]|uniref:Uncharacterized protein n=1 Tax=Plasmodium vinckei lentum TaxID=138297 RepID=A0A6V7SHQ1_PLAVN|nr:conserved Plasmodium protein, unknown function [Plasmodium vinckei lentum]
MKSEDNGSFANIPGYYYDKKKNRYFLIDNELKKKLKKEEFNNLINEAKKKNHKNKAEENEYIKKFHKIHGIKEMKKKKKNINASKLNIKNNDNEKCTILDKNHNSSNNIEKNLQLINNEIIFLKKSISENQNIYNVIKSIRNCHFKEDSILSLPPVFININNCEYISVEDLCELQLDNQSFYQKKKDNNIKTPNILSIKRSGSSPIFLNDFKCFNPNKKTLDENNKKDKPQIYQCPNNELHDGSKQNQNQNIAYNSKSDESFKNVYNNQTKNYSYINSLPLKSESSIEYHSIEKSLLVPKLYGRTYEKINSYNIENLKSKITANRYKANFYYFYNNNTNYSSMNSINYNDSYNMILSENQNGEDINNNNNNGNDNNGVSNIEWNPLPNTQDDMIYQESHNYFENNTEAGTTDEITNEARVSKSYKPSESFFHLFSNPLYEDIIFSTSKENNFSFSLGAIDLKKFLNKNNKSFMDNIIHENAYYNSETNHLCSYSKEQSELLCTSPQILSHFTIFNEEYVAYSSYTNTKDDKCLLFLLSIESFFQSAPKIETINFQTEINYFKLFPSMETSYSTNENYYNNNDMNLSSNTEYAYHYNNELDKIFICGSYPCFSFSTIKDSTPYCIWDSKKLKVHDLLLLNEGSTSYIDNILNSKRYTNPIHLTHGNTSQTVIKACSKKGKEKKKNETEKGKRHESNKPSNQSKKIQANHHCNNTAKRKNDNKRKNSTKDSRSEDYTDEDINNNKYEFSKKGNNNSTEKNNCNRLSKNNSPKSSLLHSSEKSKGKHNTPYNPHSPNYVKCNYNDNKKKGICCENIKKTNNNIFLLCNTEYLYLCDLRCNVLNTISKLKPNEGYVNKLYSLNNNYQYILSKTNNHIGLYDMRYIPYKCNDELKSNLVVSYDRFINNDNLKKHLNDFYVIDNEQFIVSLDTYTNAVHIYDIMNTANKIINLDGHEHSKNNTLHSYINLSRIPYIYASPENEDYYYNYYKKKASETKATDSKHTNHLNPLKSYPKKDLFIGLNVQSILPLFYVKQKYCKYNFISINEGGFICTINI